LVSFVRTLILGGGFGGISVATELRRLVGEDHEIVLVDRAERFSMGLRKLWELIGHATIAEGSRPREALAAQGVRVVCAEIDAIDPAARAATLGGETIEADHVVVALGAASRPDLVPGLVEHGYDVWSTGGVPGAAEALAEFDGGRVIVLVAGAPYPCPPAPFECVMHVDQHLRARGIRDRTELAVATIQPMLMPNAGADGSAWMADQLAARDIGFHVGAKIERVDEKSVVLTDGELSFALLIAVPPHRVPEVVRASGLTAESGWVAVDKGTFATEWPEVYAVGDVTQILLANGLPLPKAGIIAELEGSLVARAIAAIGEGRGLSFDGVASCYVEMGSEVAARVDADWYATPAPVVSIAEPSSAYSEEKRQFERERLERWFGG
jgi:sulfide:quinone oxidoreductase